MENSDLQLMGIVLIFGSILFLAYVAARFVGKKASASMQSKHMQVVEQISLGLDKRLLLVRVGTEYFLFLSSKREFKQVARVKLDTDDEQEQHEAKQASGEPVFDFRQIFDKYIHTRAHEKRRENTPRDAAVSQNSEALQKNIRKLEQLRGKSDDKEV